MSEVWRELISDMVNNINTCPNGRCGTCIKSANLIDDYAGEQQSQLDQANAEIAELKKRLGKFKLHGTDECPDYIEQFGRAPIGADYPRGTLYYMGCLDCQKKHPERVEGDE